MLPSEFDAFYTNEKIRTVLAGMKPSIVYEKFYEIEKFFSLKFSAAIANLMLFSFYTNEKMRTMLAGMKPSIVYEKFHRIEKFVFMIKKSLIKKPNKGKIG